MSTVGLTCFQTFVHGLLASSRWDAQLWLVQDRHCPRFKLNCYRNGGLP